MTADAPGTTVTIDAPVGTDTFDFATFDAQSAKGNLLGSATVSKPIVLGAANTVSVVLDGAVASVTVSIGNPSPNAGVPATVPVRAASIHRCSCTSSSRTRRKRAPSRSRNRRWRAHPLRSR